ncbi:hypothetical protein TSUD_354430 [Trifolium subterraneum]|uniref:NB-ARC domain-containing protein n=1 Tax=Trifolium subterraneum TaxID=3900 RepID=A0A2Z6P4J1_TRISU|nr:hypothetical protein TSUD_354430 [Trifolium subterraneum]
MAEQIPYGVATSIINRLASVALREYGRIHGVKDALERLKNTVEFIRAVLLDAEQKQEQSHAVQNWVRRLKDVLIPADDLLDEFHIQDMIHKREEPHRNKVKKVLHSFSLNKFALHRNMAIEIEKIQKMFDDVVRDISGLNLNPTVRVVQETNIEWRETDSYVIESDIIGRAGDKEKIVNLLRQPHGDQNVSLVAIVGIGGLGKTTLTQLVYSDVEVKNLFEKSMWICVSDNFDVKTIVKKMLESLTNDKIDDTLPLDILQNRLRHNLTGKKYLLVLDDVWNDNFEKWEKLRTYLMCGAQGSKVVVTTRSTIVAHTMDVSVPYVLSGLIQEESWSLLKNIAFRDDTNGVNQTIESIGKMIAEKCKGVPLAIRSLGGILKTKRDEEEWGHVLRGDFWKLCEDEESILPILKLSYHDLSPQQRQCFAYCSLFPKDWEFVKDELIQMWMAHGYLDCPVEEKSMEDVGNQFVNTFLMKSFFQEAKWNEDGDIIGFKMHDLMHDLAKQVAGDDCCYLDNNRKGCPERPVHVWVEFEAFYLLKSLVDASFKYLPPLERLPFLKSLGIYSLDDLEYIYYEELILNEPFFPSLKRLLIQNLEFYDLASQHFQAIEIWFKDDINNYLPSLQKITFYFCKDLKALPDWICKISSLQHIKIHGCIELTLLPEGITSLTNLNTLEIIYCPLLTEECEKETSATRARIANIPNIIMK